MRIHFLSCLAMAFLFFAGLHVTVMSMVQISGGLPFNEMITVASITATQITLCVILLSKYTDRVPYYTFLGFMSGILAGMVFLKFI